MSARIQVSRNNNTLVRSQNFKQSQTVSVMTARMANNCLNTIMIGGNQD